MANDTKSGILRKYFKVWLKFTKEEKNLKDLALKNEKINNFLEVLIQQKKELRKSQREGTKNIYDRCSNSSSSSEKDENKLNNKNSLINNSGSYHYRFQAQKNIIALQKTQLEQQKRFIEELKLKRIVEDASLGEEAAKEVGQSLIQCDKTVKSKLKFIIRESPIEIDSDKLLELHCMKVPKFIQRMEQRAREREEKRAIVRERRRQMDSERERMKEQMQIARQLLDHDERNKKLSEFKEKRKQEQLTAIRNQQMRERIRGLMVMADLHYEKKLILKYGFRAWSLFVKKTKDNFSFAVRHDELSLLKKHFIGWHKYTQQLIDNRNERADAMHNYKLTRWIYNEWKAEHTVMVHKRQVAEDWFELHVTERLFALWRSNVLYVRLIRQRQWDKAVDHHNSRLVWRVIGYWQTLPTIIKLEREHEARKQRWRLKVLQVLPDYIPRELD